MCLKWAGNSFLVLYNFWDLQKIPFGDFYTLWGSTKLFHPVPLGGLEKGGFHEECATLHLQHMESLHSALSMCYYRRLVGR